MNRRFLPLRAGLAAASLANQHNRKFFALRMAVCLLSAFAGAGAGVGVAQVLVVDTSGKGNVATTGPVDRRYAQIEPTHVELSKEPLDPTARIMLIRSLESDQGFAMRPFPRGHKGLTLAANGKLEPAGVNYLNMVVSQGLSAKPGQRVVITNIRIDRSKIVLDFNGGPDPRHRFLRHVQISAGPQMGDPDIDPALTNPNGEPVGSRLTLTFAGRVPELTPAQLKALLAPLLSFDVKSPIQAFTDTLPKDLKNAILDHKVLVGMSTDMVLFAKGQPSSKVREMDGQMPFEEWIYGKPPEDVDFVRINGNRVIRVEIARAGQPLQIFTQDVVSPMMLASGQPEFAANTRTVAEGDVQPDPDKQAPAAPPSLRLPGEQLPADNTRVGVMRPVQFPGSKQPGSNPDEQPSQPASQSHSAPASYPQGEREPSPANDSGQPKSGSQPQSAPPPPPPQNGSQPPSGVK